MMIKEQYEAPEILVEDYVCECGFYGSGFSVEDGEDDDFENLEQMSDY